MPATFKAFMNFSKFYLLLSYVQSYHACFHATVHVLSRMSLLDKYNSHSSLHIHHKISENDKVAKLKITIRLHEYLKNGYVNCSLHLSNTIIPANFVFNLSRNHRSRAHAAISFDVFSFCFLLENCCISLYTSLVTDQRTNPLSFSIFLSCASNLNNCTNMVHIRMYINS